MRLLAQAHPDPPPPPSSPSSSSCSCSALRCACSGRAGGAEIRGGRCGCRAAPPGRSRCSPAQAPPPPLSVSPLIPQLSTPHSRYVAA
eukprot:1375626-Rhodomonas_salina.1